MTGSILSNISDICEILTFALFSVVVFIYNFHKSHGIKIHISNLNYGKQYVSFKISNESGSNSNCERKIGYRIYFTDNESRRSTLHRCYILPNVFTPFRNIKSIKLNGTSLIKTRFFDVNDKSQSRKNVNFSDVSNASKHINFCIPINELQYEFECKKNDKHLNTSSIGYPCINFEFIYRDWLGIIHKKQVKVFEDLLNSNILKALMSKDINGHGINLNNMKSILNSIHTKALGYINHPASKENMIIDRLMGKINNIISELDITKKNQENVYRNCRKYLSSKGIDSNTILYCKLKEEKRFIEENNNFRGYFLRINSKTLKLINKKIKDTTKYNSRIKCEFYDVKALHMNDVCKVSEKLLNIVGNELNRDKT